MIFATVHDNTLPPGPPPFISFIPKLTCCAPFGGTITPAGPVGPPPGPPDNPSNMGFWYLNADLGPLSPCSTSTGTPPIFDTASGVADNSINWSATPRPRTSSARHPKTLRSSPLSSRTRFAVRPPRDYHPSTVSGVPRRAAVRAYGEEEQLSARRLVRPVRAAPTGDPRRALAVSVPALGRSRNSLIGQSRAVDCLAPDTRLDCAFAPVLGANSHRRKRLATPGRMTENAALLADEVLPRQPLRQWVRSLPFALRFLLATARAQPHSRSRLLAR